jgi:hypothetical protein
MNSANIQRASESRGAAFTVAWAAATAAAKSPVLKASPALLMTISFC